MEHDPRYIDMMASYMGVGHEPDEVLSRAKYALSDVEFDTLVGTGLSGALVIPQLARSLGVRYLIVRKPDESSHSPLTAEGWLGTRWLFVDDFILTGATFTRVYQEVQKISYNQNHRTEFVGAFSYTRECEEGRWHPFQSAEYVTETFLPEALRGRKSGNGLSRLRSRMR